MESIPEQHIDALPGATRREAYEKIGLIWLARSRGITSKDQIAMMAKFGSAEAMQGQLKRWGLTGLLPPEKQEEPPKPKVEKPGPSGRNSSPPEEVADTSAAADLFNEALDGLARVVEDLDDLDLSYQGKRFAGTYRLRGRFTFLRKSYSEPEWRVKCEEYGQDPDVERFSVDDLPAWDFLGVSPYPPREVVALIAAYALSDRPIEPLMEALFPGYSQEDPEEVRELFYQTKRPDGKDGLRRTAEQFAAAVYGRKVEKGSPATESRRKHRLACHITAQREAGVPDEKIFQDIRAKGHELPKEEFDRLARLEELFKSGKHSMLNVTVDVAENLKRITYGYIALTKRDVEG
jgi:hypothetical protein